MLNRKWVKGKILNGHAFFDLNHFLVEHARFTNIEIEELRTCLRADCADVLESLCNEEGEF